MGFRNFAGGSTDYGGHVTRVGGSWWWPALFGVISIIAGILALVWPGPTLVVLAILAQRYDQLERLIIVFLAFIAAAYIIEIFIVRPNMGVAAGDWVVPTFPAGSIVLAILFGIDLIVWGIYRLVGAVTIGDASGGARTLWAILGILSLLIGFYALRHIVITLLSLGLLLGIFWLVDGIGLVVSAIEHRGMPGRGLSVLSGVFGIIAGLILLVWPAISVLTLAVLAGIWLIVFGFVQLGMANQLRHAHTR